MVFPDSIVPDVITARLMTAQDELPSHVLLPSPVEGKPQSNTLDLGLLYFAAYKGFLTHRKNRVASSIHLDTRWTTQQMGQALEEILTPMMHEIRGCKNDERTGWFFSLLFQLVIEAHGLSREMFRVVPVQSETGEFESLHIIFVVENSWIPQPDDSAVREIGEVVMWLEQKG